MSATLRRVGAQGWFEFLAIARNGEQILLNLIMPLIAVILLAKTNLIDTEASDWDRASLALIAGLSLSVMSSAFTSVAIATGFDRRAGFLRYLGTTPLRRSGLIAGKALAVLILVAFQFVIMVGAALALGWNFDALRLLTALGPIGLATGAFAAWALLLAGTLRAEAVLALANLIWLALVMTAGAELIGPSLPQAASAAVALLPSAALVSAVGSGVSTATLALVPLGVLAVWLIVGVIATNRWFKWD